MALHCQTCLMSLVTSFVSPSPLYSSLKKSCCHSLLLALPADSTQGSDATSVSALARRSYTPKPTFSTMHARTHVRCRPRRQVSHPNYKLKRRCGAARSQLRRLRRAAKSVDYTSTLKGGLTRHRVVGHALKRQKPPFFRHG